MNESYSERHGRRPRLDLDGLIQFVFRELADFEDRGYFWEAFNSYEIHGERHEARLPHPERYVITELGRPGLWEWLGDPARVARDGAFPSWDRDTLYDVLELFHNVVVAAPILDADETFEGYSRPTGQREFREAMNGGLALADPPAELTEDGRILEISAGDSAPREKRPSSDIFISYEHEAGNDVARRLAESLKELGFSVSVADQLTAAGSAVSRVAVLGPEFLNSEWTPAELDLLAEREPPGGGEPIILVSHGIDEGQVRTVAPSLADRSELSIDLGLDRVVEAIARAVRRGEDDGPDIPGAGAGPVEASGSFASRHPWLVRALTPLLVTVVGGVIVGLILGWFGPGSGGTSTVVREISGSTLGSSAGAEAGAGQGGASSAGVVEFSDNRNGSPVFADPAGAPVEGNHGGVIPYGTKVVVSCFAADRSGMESVIGFYRIAEGEWKGDYVVADTMTNGGPIGNTGTPRVDPRVEPCEPGG